MTFTEADRIIESLKPLFERAERDGLWFQHSSYGDVVLSPLELRDHHAAGRFLHGSYNWLLVNPADELARLDAAILTLRTQRDRLIIRIQQSRRSDPEGPWTGV